eukprot:TRINITY_DN9836_c0_g1_i1.p1 TRINITY_DN9836_c0_g1~~TRINITY_DN9836_c0_g1_i1.p1  ORF type:complete len:588 (+),score=86.92 TRINITY_DN9836_c0_g1_i1:208-1764(+)
MYYRIAIELYNNNAFSDALHPTNMASETMKEFLEICPEADLESSSTKSNRIETLLSAVKQKAKSVQDEDPVQSALDVLVDRAERCKTFRQDIFSPLVRTFVSRKIKAIQAQSKTAGAKCLFNVLRNVPQLSVHQLGKLLEEEMVLYETYLPSKKSQAIMVADQLLTIYNKDEYPISRATVLIDRARLMRSESDLAISLVDKALRLYKCEDPGCDKSLQDHFTIFVNMVVALLWRGIFQWESYQSKQSESMDWIDSFDKAIACWSQLLHGMGPATAASIKKNSAKFHNIDSTIDLLDEVSDLLELLQRHELQIQILKILLNVYEYVPEPSQYDIVKAQTKIAANYRKLGYDGLSASYFGMAKEIVDEYELVTISSVEGNEDILSLPDVEWILISSIFFYEMDELDPKQMRDACQSLLSSYLLGPDARKSNFLAKFLYILSYIHEQEGDVVAATDSALEGLYTLLSIFPQQELERLWNRSKKRFASCRAPIYLVTVLFRHHPMGCPKRPSFLNLPNRLSL